MWKSKRKATCRICCGSQSAVYPQSKHVAFGRDPGYTGEGYQRQAESRDPRLFSDYWVLEVLKEQVDKGKKMPFQSPVQSTDNNKITFSP